MNNIDYVIYGVHTVFWWSFVIARMIVKRSAGKGEPPAGPPSTSSRTARWSRALLWFHAVAFGLMYFGIGVGVMGHRVPVWFAGQRIAGSAVILLGAALVAWAVLHFRSWRFRAALDNGHQLATGGPFRIMRHPIYMGLNLLAFGSAIWVPSTVLWVAAAWMAVGSDLRGRAEEKILEERFGAEYRDYCARVRRFIPGIY